ncbi:hypothetical protein HS327_02310 [Glaesserella parasuis]|nr:hypothetical protein HS327_02310 [Glaesserella parasuis]
MQVTQICLYPIKSTQAYRVEQAFVLPQGLNFDREFMITEVDGTFITARKEQMLYRLAAFPISTGIVIQSDCGERCVALLTILLNSDLAKFGEVIFHLGWRTTR